MYKRQGLARIRRAVADARGGDPAAPGARALLARVELEACARAGEPAAGLAAADEALAAGGAIGLWEAEVRRLRAEFGLALGWDPADAEVELDRAIAIAQRQGARSLERRARDSRDRLLGERTAERSQNAVGASMPSESHDRR